MWVAPRRKVGVSVLVAALAVSVYVSSQSWSAHTHAPSLEEPVLPVASVDPLDPAAMAVTRPEGVVAVRRDDSSAASSVDVMMTSIRSALAAWSEFVGSGETTVLDSTFDPEGPQHRQLVSEVPLLGDAVAGVQFDLVGVQLAATGDTSALVDTWIVLVIGGESSVLQWRFHLTPHRGRWRVWTIEERAGPRPSPEPE